MKILIYGLQSSGGTALAFLMAQRPNTIAVLDLVCSQLAPDLDADAQTHDVVLKCTATTYYSLAEHKKTFKPDLTILNRRNLDDVRTSLSTKRWCNHCGKMEDKFKVFQAIPASMYDLEVYYDDFQTPVLDFWLTPAQRKCPKSLKEVIDYTCRESEWCRQHYKRKWGKGGLHEGKLPLVKTPKQIPLL